MRARSLCSERIAFFACFVCSLLIASSGFAEDRPQSKRVQSPFHAAEVGGGSPTSTASDAAGIPGQVETAVASQIGTEEIAVADDVNWWDGFGQTAQINGSILAATTLNGDLILGGDFAIDLGFGQRVVNLARWNGRWSGFVPDSGLEWGDSYDPGRVYALAVFNGELIVGGDFKISGPWPASSTGNIAKWTGTTWAPLGPGANFPVRCLMVRNGVLIAGGSFTNQSIGNRIAWWDGSSWHEFGSGMDGDVFALSEFGSVLVAGGDFANAGGVPASKAAYWDGTSWISMGPGLQGGPVLSAVNFRGMLVTAGTFNLSGEANVGPVVQWDGRAWRDLQVPAYEAYALAQFRGSLFVASDATGSIKRWEGSSWVAVGQGLTSAPHSLAVYQDRLVAGANYVLPEGGTTVAGISSCDGDSWGAIANGLNGPVVAVYPYEGGLAVAGRFSLAGEQAVGGIARWDGKHWESLSPPGVQGLLAAANAFVEYNGDLIAGGSNLLYPYSGLQGHVARWNGTAWEMGDLAPGPEGDVVALASYHRDLIAAGSFASAGGISAMNIARYDGSVWHPLSSGTNGVVKALAVFDDKLIAGGEFTIAGDSLASHIAAWDGAGWNSVGAGMDGPVLVLLVDQGKLFAGGSFSWAGGTQAYRIAAWDGQAWTAMGSWINGNVNALCSFGRVLFAGGTFTWADGGASHIARWNGSRWRPLGSGTGAVFTLASYQYSLFVGGNFGGAGGKGSYNIARWDHILTDVGDPQIAAIGTPLWRSYPNPFGPQTTFRFVVDRPSQVRLSIFDARGRLVTTLVDGSRTQGAHSATWDGQDSAGRKAQGGVYFARLSANGSQQTTKVVLRR